VDDSELVTEALAVLLDAAGYRSRAAASVREALDAARDERPDVALIDLTLPDGDGLEIVRTLAEEGRAPRASVALTGHDDPDTEARCLAAGCRAVLVKPVRPSVLVAGLREWLAD
jgi:two-component system KDP operon response regulator KdpE